MPVKISELRLVGEQASGGYAYWPLDGVYLAKARWNAFVSGVFASARDERRNPVFGADAMATPDENILFGKLIE